MNIKVKKITSIPNKTKVITNDGEWLTLATNASVGVVSLVTCKSDETNNLDFHDDSIWQDYRIDELKTILKIFR